MSVTIGPIQALGTVWHLETASNVPGLQTALTSKLTEFEHRYSRFLTDSLVSQLNRNGSLNNPPEELTALLTAAQEFYTATDGLFNVLTGGVQIARGYDTTYSFTETLAEPVIGNSVHDLTIKSNHITLAKGQLDLGGCGKGWLIDVLTDWLEAEYGLTEFVINGGGDMRVVTPETSATLYLEHPTKPGVLTDTLTVPTGSALAVSSTHKRTWQAKNTSAMHNHIVSPDLESTPAISVAVVARTALVADVLATVACTNAPLQKRLEILGTYDVTYAITTETTKYTSPDWSTVATPAV